MPKGHKGDYRLKDTHPQVKGNSKVSKAKFKDFEHHQGKGPLPMSRQKTWPEVAGAPTDNSADVAAATLLGKND